MGAKGRQQARSQGRAGSRKAVKQGVAGMLLETLLELLIELLERFDQATQLFHQSRDHQPGRSQHGRIAGQGLRLADLLDPLLDGFHLVTCVEETTSISEPARVRVEDLFK